MPTESATNSSPGSSNWNTKSTVLPAEDLVLYLRMPAAEAHRLAGEAERGARNYTKLRRDLQESDIAHLEAASAVYDNLARQPHWAKSSASIRLRARFEPPEAIHAEILAAIDARIASRARRKDRILRI